MLVTIGFYYFEEFIDSQKTNSTSSGNENKLSFYYLPSSTTGVIITHNNYTLSYSEKHEQPEWVAYQLKKEHLSKNEFKRPFFKVDKKVRTSSADWRNYKNSGYDKGHLCPAGDRRFSYNAFEETFLTSNISPQNHDFNAGIWNELEQKIRYWASKYDGVYVVTGGILVNDLKTIGYEAVSVPRYFYKVVLNVSGKNKKMIGFLMPNEPSEKPLVNYVVPVDEIEKRTGIDFFADIEDQEEQKLEVSVDKTKWKF